MWRSPTALVVLIAGCYSPRPPEGAPCNSTRECPSPQSCVLDHCSSHDAQALDPVVLPDAAEEIDAAIASDARPDAAVLPCTAEGFASCGTATLFTCGGHCWVRCSNATVWPNANTACIGWKGALGKIDDATEQSCVASRAGSNTWIGLLQSDAATTPSEGWGWTGDANPMVFTNWQPGTPNDRDNVESRTEQCGMIQTDGRWDDVACMEQHVFFCER